MDCLSTVRISALASGIAGTCPEGPGMQEAAAEMFDSIFEVDENENSNPNVCKMLADGDEVESRPYRSRTCDTLIKSHGVLV